MTDLVSQIEDFLNSERKTAGLLERHIRHYLDRLAWLRNERRKSAKYGEFWDLYFGYQDEIRRIEMLLFSAGGLLRAEHGHHAELVDYALSLDIGQCTPTRHCQMTGYRLQRQMAPVEVGQIAG